MEIDASGWLRGATHIPTPNFDQRLDSCVELLVIHSISLPPNEFGGAEVAAFFTNQLDPEAHPYFKTIADLKVSSHFFIRRDGQVMQFVSCLCRAWHAGASIWQGRARCNDFSIGVELEGSDYVPFTAAQYDVLVELTKTLQSTYPLIGIAGHNHIAPARKTDPGPYFDWARYFLAVAEK